MALDWQATAGAQAPDGDETATARVGDVAHTFRVARIPGQVKAHIRFGLYIDGRHVRTVADAPVAKEIAARELANLARPPAAPAEQD